MSPSHTGVKKPPLAPKPKLPTATTTTTTTRPSPPPIAPKPGLLPQPPVVPNPSPSPATLKRAKPALAPKPCVLVAPQTRPPGPAHTQSQEPSDASLHLLNSKNGMCCLSSSPRNSLSDLDYIIPACCPPGGPEGDPPLCQRLHNGNGGGGGGDDDLRDEVRLQNGDAVEGHPATPVTTGEADEEEGQEEEEEEEEERGEAEEGRRVTDGLQPKPRGKPERHKHLARGRTGGEGQGSPEAPRQQLREAESGAETETERCPETVALGQVAEDSQPLDETRHHETSQVHLDTGAVATAQTLSSPPPPPPSPSPSPPPHPSPSEPPQWAYDEPDGARTTHATTNGRASPPPAPPASVPAAPSKPLPVPHPRRAKKPPLVRQDGLEDGCGGGGVPEGEVAVTAVPRSRLRSSSRAQLRRTWGASVASSPGSSSAGHLSSAAASFHAPKRASPARPRPPQGATSERPVMSTVRAA